MAVDIESKSTIDDLQNAILEAVKRSASRNNVDIRGALDQSVRRN